MRKDGADVFVGKLQRFQLSDQIDKLKNYGSYAGDIFANATVETDFSTLFNTVNRTNSSIKFTLEMESAGSLHFFDVLLNEKPDGSIRRGVYRKLSTLARTLPLQIVYPFTGEHCGTRPPEQGQMEEVGAGYIFIWSGRPKAGITFPITIAGRLSCLPQGIDCRLVSLRSRGVGKSVHLCASRVANYSACAKSQHRIWEWKVVTLSDGLGASGP
ncbi:hypothetical protein SprV_0200806500 [Sparganum proliferum]